VPEPVCSQETAEHIVRQSQAFTAYSEKYVPARQRFTAHRRTSVACSVGRLHLLTLAPFELRLVAQIVASDNTASGTRSQHLSFVERQAARRTGSRHSPAQLRPRDTSVPGKPDHTVGIETFRDDTNHSYISRPERTGHLPINSMDELRSPCCTHGRAGMCSKTIAQH